MTVSQHTALVTGGMGGSLQGGLSGLPAHALGATLIRSVLEKTGVAPEQIDEVILGQILTAGADLIIAGGQGVAIAVEAP